MEHDVNAEFTLSVNYSLITDEQLRELLHVVLQPQFAEIWLTGLGGTLAIYKNGDMAWLMFMHHMGDEGFHSVNPNYVGPADDKLELYMKNGQRDEKPRKEWIPIREAQRAVEYFFHFGARAQWIAWYDDSRPE